MQQVCNKLNSVCYTLRVLKKYLGLQVLMTVYYANFYSTLRFGVIFWGGSVDAHRAFVVQKRAVRILLGLNNQQSCRGRFRELGLFTLAGLYVYECVVYLYSNKNKFEIHRSKHDYPTRSINYTTPRHRLSLTERIPTYSCVQFFNSLPEHLKKITSLKEFKTSVKNFIIDREPYSIAE